MTLEQTQSVERLSLIRLGLIDYLEAWQLQREHLAQVAEGAVNRVLLLEHPPVFTAGRRTEPHERPFDGTPVIDVDRGGKITWHGPGQIVGYPIIALPESVGVVDYVRQLESLIIKTCNDFGIDSGRVTGRSGVWINGDRKIAAIGVRVARGVTMHGFALNVNPDLSWYDRIVPCGISDAAVTSIEQELGRTVSVADVLPVLERRIVEELT